ncbi:MAG: hypothetical protein A2X36_14550 [Elusimicrobia bacterium GWA2_69_24]|nr:MAG: hypothetical protein A2X36_14550 [Elusimicrobia bacterium GWA2_69_24]HBL18386.1 hypothetical protein [Elusimicrobiota bacterium]
MAEAGDWVPETREISDLVSSMEREQSAHLQGREAAYDRPLEERVAAGTTVVDAYFRGTEEGSGKPVYVFCAERNDSRFRPGTRVRLSRGDPRCAAARLELLDDRYDGAHYWFRLGGHVEQPESLESSEPWVLDEDVFDLLDTQLSILREAESEGLAAWLAGTEHREPAAGDAVSRPGLDGTLAEAFDLAVRTPRWSAIQGPPGSGKTHLLAHLALHFALVENCRVLVTAVSHQAIHQALGEIGLLARRYAESDPAAERLLGEGFLKLAASRGNNEGLPEGVRPVPRLGGRKRPVVVGATVYAAVHAAAALPAFRMFDVALFDEAGQAPLVLALGARLLAAQTVFIGDDAQLPPIMERSSEDAAGSSARWSALEFIRRRYGDPHLLRETRRLNAELCSVVSDCFYGSALEPTSASAGRALVLRSRPRGPFAEILRSDRSLVFVDVPHEGCRGFSEPEALWASAVAMEAVRCGLAAEEIGVIAPYRAQANRIRFLLGRRGPAASTVERFQGQEREMIVVSLTSSDLRYLGRLAAFLFNPNRINVAVSRARTKVVLLGSRQALMTAAEAAEDAGGDLEGGNGLQVFKRIMDRAHLIRTSGAPPAAGAGGPEPAERETEGAEEAFSPGDLVEHGVYGPGRVLSKSLEVFDERREWVNRVQFQDGTVRMIIPRLSEPRMRRSD